MGLFLLALGRALEQILVFFLPAFLVFYRLMWRLRQWFGRILLPVKRRVFYLLAHRFFVHLLIIIIAFWAWVGASRAGSDPASPVGEASLLFQSLETEEEIIQESGLPEFLPPDEADFFLDLPLEELEPDIALTNQGGAMMKIDVSPSGLASTRTQPEEYLVQPGDTLIDIADKFGVSINTILWENKLSVHSVIRPGQKLIILPITGISHKIKKGENVERLAKKYGVTTEEIISFNGLTTGQVLNLDQLLIIPGGVPVAPPLPAVIKKPAPVQVVYPPVPSGPGMFWPAAATRISQYFSWRHPGLDIAGPRGTPVYAADDGIVTLVEKRRTGYGWQILINHENGFKTRYAHHSQILVVSGQRVKKGEMIALIGSTGRSSGSHLHFEIYSFNRRVNPLGYVKR